MIQKSNDWLARFQDFLCQYFLGFGKIKGGAVSHMVSSPCFTVEQNAFSNCQNYNISLGRDFDCFGDKLAVILDRCVVNLVDITPIGVGITGVIVCDLASFRKEKLRRVLHKAPDSFKDRNSFERSSGVVTQPAYLGIGTNHGNGQSGLFIKRK